MSTDVETLHEIIAGIRALRTRGYALGAIIGHVETVINEQDVFMAGANAKADSAFIDRLPRTVPKIAVRPGETLPRSDALLSPADQEALKATADRIHTAVHTGDIERAQTLARDVTLPRSDPAGVAALTAERLRSGLLSDPTVEQARADDTTPD